MILQYIQCGCQWENYWYCLSLEWFGLMYLLQVLIQKENVHISCQEGAQEGVMTSGSCCCLGAISLQNLQLYLMALMFLFISGH